MINDILLTAFNEYDELHQNAYIKNIEIFQS